MISSLRKLFGSSSAKAGAAPHARPVVGNGRIEFEGGVLDLRVDARVHEGVPHPHWQHAYAWIESFDKERRAAAWLACERGWLEWLRGAIGERYRLYESGHALLLSSESERMAQVMLAYIGATLKRVQRVLEDLTEPTELGKEILIAFDNEDDYYRYVSGFYPENGEFAMSSGMHLSGGCSHFVTHGTKLDAIEPVIVHEMTHSCLAHRTLPAWLNEGMAVNTERVLGHGAQEHYREQELLTKHHRFWTPESIQEFWSGSAYLRPDEANELSYDLGRILVNGLSHDWEGFKRFVADVDIRDAGAASAARHLHIDLGEFVRLFLQREDESWGPDPSRWLDAPERGGALDSATGGSTKGD